MQSPEALLAAANITDKKLRQDKYGEILLQLIAATDVEGLKCFVEQGEFVVSSLLVIREHGQLCLETHRCSPAFSMCKRRTVLRTTPERYCFRGPP